MSALKTVLVVDDDPVIGTSFDRVLTRRGYKVIKAANGDEALSKLAGEDYDAVFTDIKMPGISGIEVAERVRANKPWTPVVIITGFGSAENEERAKAAGVAAFLRKPLSPEMIATSAAAAIATAETAIAIPPAPAAAAPAGVAEGVSARVAEAADGSRLANLAKLAAMPFAGLAFVLLLPVVGLAALAWMAVQAVRARHAAGLAAGRTLHRALEVAKNLGLFFAAPFIALAYIMVFPAVGMLLLARTGAEAWRNRSRPA